MFKDGHRACVWWPGSKRFFVCTVLSFDPLSSMYEVLYDDGERATEPLDFGDRNDPNEEEQTMWMRQTIRMDTMDTAAVRKLEAASVKEAKAAADDRQKLTLQKAKRISDERAGRIKKRHALVVAQTASEKKRLAWLAKMEKLFTLERAVTEAAAELVAAEATVVTYALQQAYLKHRSSLTNAQLEGATASNVEVLLADIHNQWQPGKTTKVCACSTLPVRAFPDAFLALALKCNPCGTGTKLKFEWVGALAAFDAFFGGRLRTEYGMEWYEPAAVWRAPKPVLPRGHDVLHGDATLQYCPDTQKLKFTVRHGHEPDICNPVYV